MLDFALRHFKWTGAGHKKIRQAAVRGLGDATEGNGVFVLDGYIEVITSLEVELIPNDFRQDDLAFLG